MKRQTNPSKTPDLSRKRERFITRESQETHFLAVDLEIISRRPLHLLVPAFGDHIGVLRNEKLGRKNVLLLSTGAYVSHDDNIDKLVNKLISSQVKLVQALPAEAREQWDNATTRTFDIGIQAGKKPAVYEIKLAPRTFSSISAIGGSIQITVYGSVRRYHLGSH